MPLFAEIVMCRLEEIVLGPTADNVSSVCHNLLLHQFQTTRVSMPHRFTNAYGMAAWLITPLLTFSILVAPVF